MSAPSYSTMEDPKKEPVVPFDQGRAWESRGSILGLLIDVGGATASQLIMLVPMVANSLSKDGTFMSCDETLHPVLKTPTMLFLCEYLTAFALVFPVLAATAIMLLIGRNLLQKRFYYGMLQAGGVVTFAQNNVFKEIIFWVIVVSYVHCLGYLALVIYVCRREGNFYVSNGSLVMGENEGLMIGSCISLLLLPGALFTVFFFCAYDVEYTLVPLSQYVHDAHDVAKSEAADVVDPTGLSQLENIHDSHMCMLLQEKEAELLATAGDHEAKFRETLEVYRSERAELRKRELSSIGLFESFWPGRLLLKPVVQGEAGGYFKVLWFTIVSVFLLVFLCLIGYLLVLIAVDLWRISKGDVLVLGSTAVLLVHLIVVLGFLWPFLESITWRWASSPISGVVEAGSGARGKLTP
eukprot:TRINITY_DN76503_c0_g1_i1.p1 TRINITY_DN76503_c0_g1~~TRINITY_DN76503_c0_g1_i1.p1  ORF type:complete len:409 (+),score=80.12 TRINITY_DN76503_c0_g1_i1:144-1370(+)